jgi:hypothetical protein
MQLNFHTMPDSLTICNIFKMTSLLCHSDCELKGQMKNHRANKSCQQNLLNERIG